MHRLLRPTPHFARRGIQTFEALDSQVNILRNGKAVIAQGSGGRSSRTGYTVTVFGGPGLVGTALISRLGKHGTLVTVPYREETHQRHLKVMGDLGVVNYIEYDLRNVESIENSVKSSDVVVNLVGRDWETKNFSFYDVHVEGARRIAQAAKKFNVPRFVHVSTHSPDLSSNSKFIATKAAGEEVVRELIPDATIVRPAPVFGPSDMFLNLMAQKKFWFEANQGLQTMAPTHVTDVAAALEKIVYDDSTAGQVFELYGSESFQLREIHKRVKNAVKKDLRLVTLPKPVVKAIATFFQYAAYWVGPLTPDQVERMFVDQRYTKGAKSYADLGIKPLLLSELFVPLLRFHRPSSFLHDSEETDKRRKKLADSWSNIID